MRTLDPAPVLKLARLKLGEDGWRADCTQDHLKMVDGAPRIAELCGVSVGTVARWVGGSRRLSHRTADEVAIRLGLHPCLIWGDDWWQS